MPIYKQCCCGCRLAQGVQIYGWIALVIDILVIITLGTQINSKKSSTPSTYSRNYYDNDLNQYSDSSSSTNNFVVPLSTAVIISLIVFNVILVITLICLIIGASKLKKHLLLPFLVVQAINLAFTLINGLYQLFQHKPSEVMFSLFIFAAIFGVFVYLYLVVVSLYQEISENESRPLPFATHPIPSNVNYQPSGFPQPANTPYSNPTTVSIYPNLKA